MGAGEKEEVGTLLLADWRLGFSFKKKLDWIRRMKEMEIHVGTKIELKVGLHFGSFLLKIVMLSLRGD